MSEPTDAPQEAASAAPARDPAAARQPAAARKPRLALLLATACGLGYIPKAPGTFGSLAGLILLCVPRAGLILAVLIWGGIGFWGRGVYPLRYAQELIALLTAAIGVWSASRASSFWGEKDPQRVVIDEVSGQHLTLLLALCVPIWWRGTSAAEFSSFSFVWPGGSFHTDVLSWKYLLLGFILFRVFDIWKPFPARQAESLPGGWGIMADDWVAGIYAAIGLWIARAAGL
jgi:phosphatidylglycerophosphatase A